MTHWRALSDRDTLGAYHLVGADGKPRDFTLEIERVVQGEVKSAEKPRGERRPLIYFKGAKRPLVCNATNGKTITSIAGSPHIERWVGLRITLYPTTTKVKGEPIDCVRIRPQRATGPVDRIEDRPVDEAMRARQKAALDGDAPEREPGSDDE